MATKKKPEPVDDVTLGASLTFDQAAQLALHMTMAEAIREGLVYQPRVQKAGPTLTIIGRVQLDVEPSTSCNVCKNGAHYVLTFVRRRPRRRAIATLAKWAGTVDKRCPACFAIEPRPGRIDRLIRLMAALRVRVDSILRGFGGDEQKMRERSYRLAGARWKMHEAIDRINRGG